MLAVASQGLADKLLSVKPIELDTLPVLCNSVEGHIFLSREKKGEIISGDVLCTAHDFLGGKDSEAVTDVTILHVTNNDSNIDDFRWNARQRQKWSSHRILVG